MLSERRLKQYRVCKSVPSAWKCCFQKLQSSDSLSEGQGFPCLWREVKEVESTFKKFSIFICNFFYLSKFPTRIHNEHSGPSCRSWSRSLGRDLLSREMVLFPTSLVPPSSCWGLGDFLYLFRAGQRG